ncbi:hypothetical protein ABPG75_013261 [Micractinium tetrahymenae]
MQLALTITLLAFAVSTAAVPQAVQLVPGAGQQQEDACRWEDYQTAERISSWESQLRSKQDMNRSRAEWQELVEQSFAAAERELPDFSMDRSSRRSMIWHETAHALTTKHAQPLDPEAGSSVHFPWRQAAVLRLRACVAVEAPPEVERSHHLLEPGEADLTLKLKDVEDPQTLPHYQKGFPKKARKRQGLQELQRC